MYHCERNGCDGHLGKFSSCRDEVLHGLTLDGSYVEASTGDVAAYGHVSLLLLDGDPIVVDGFTVPPGFYTLVEDGQGFVSVVTYASEYAARKAFDAADTAYSEWRDMGGND